MESFLVKFKKACKKFKACKKDFGFISILAPEVDLGLLL